MMPSVLPIGGRVVITNPIGLHARPAVKLTKLAKQFKASIYISKNSDEAWVDAKSIVRVMGLKVKAGEALLIRADGPDARQAVDALISLAKREFEGHGTQIR
jgi:phosphocarrier protein